MNFRWHGLPLISRNALPRCSFTLLVHLCALCLLLLAYPRDMCSSLFSTFYLLPILGLFLHPAIWRFIPMLMTSKTRSTARLTSSFCNSKRFTCHGHPKVMDVV